MQVFIRQRKHDSWVFEAWLIARVTAGLTAVTDKAQGTAELVSVIEIWEEGGGDTDQCFHSLYHWSPCQLCVLYDRGIIRCYLFLFLLRSAKGDTERVIWVFICYSLGVAVPV